MIICGINFVDYAVKLGKGVNALRVKTSSADLAFMLLLVTGLIHPGNWVQDNLCICKLTLRSVIGNQWSCFSTEVRIAQW